MAVPLRFCLSLRTRTLRTTNRLLTRPRSIPITTRSTSSSPVKVPSGADRETPASHVQVDLANMTKGETSDFIQSASAEPADQTVEGASTDNPSVVVVSVAFERSVIPRGDKREEPASWKQRALAERFVAAGIAEAGELREDMTKGEISDFIIKAQAANGGKSIRAPRDEYRRAPASQRQLELASRLKVSTTVIASYDEVNPSRGELSEFIGAALKQLSKLNPDRTPPPEQRAEPSTGGQHKLAERLGIEGYEGMTRGELSDRITAKQGESVVV